MKNMNILVLHAFWNKNKKIKKNGLKRERTMKYFIRTPMQKVSTWKNCWWERSLKLNAAKVYGSY